MKILNLYAGIGGNRKLWGDEHEITAVEYDENIAAIYKDYFPNDTVIVADAHQYLLEHYKEFDFIWSSPPCPTHSRTNKIQVAAKQINARYIDMKLWQEIILLKEFFNGKYCVENVIPYYTPFVPAQQNGRHLFWCNFRIPTTSGNPEKEMTVFSKNHRDKQKKAKEFGQNIENLKTTLPHYGFDLSKIKVNQRKDKVLRNCVNPNIGLMILNAAQNIITKQNVNQLSILDGNNGSI
jgi:DNA (cytosine-5)-methyltransferase 1